MLINKIETYEHKIRIQKIASEEQTRNIKIQFRNEILNEANQKSVAMQMMFIDQANTFEDQFSVQRYGKLCRS
jgi:hypothetical protein